MVDLARPSLTVWELHDDEYVERAHVVCDETVHAHAPFAVSVSPAALVA